MEHQPEGKSVKIAATAIIWFFATGMLGICIPLVVLSGSGAILPLAVILGASAGTAVIWRNSTQQSGNYPELTSTVKELKERVIDLEAICSSNEFDLQQKLKKLESKD
ncbi:MAG TPA: hypothetical protein DEG47_09955 [Cyanobacteria bacterium UBA11148]|nr:hypothetical protein [Cyanobacteria bacterium UBA11148]